MLSFKLQDADHMVLHSFSYGLRDRLRVVEYPYDFIDCIDGWSTFGVGTSKGDGHKIGVLHKWMSWIITYKRRRANIPSGCASL